MKIGNISIPLTVDTRRLSEGLAQIWRKPLEHKQVIGMLKGIRGMTHEQLMKALVRLAESHERLRLELQGAEKMIEAFAEKFNG